jgi:hypothetical protein
MNAGGIIAVLTFMGILNIVRAVSWAGLSLLSFVIGVILVGLLFSHMYEFFKKNCKGLEEDREDFLSHKISWEDLLAKDAPRLQESKCAERLARISSICILGGIVFGFIGFFTYAC